MQPKLKKYVIIVSEGENKMVEKTNLEYCKEIAISQYHQRTSFLP